MMNDSAPPRQPPSAGLCETCRAARIVENDRGSRFVRCDRAGADLRFPKYPVLPVFRCPGYVRTTPG